MKSAVVFGLVIASMVLFIGWVAVDMDEVNAGYEAITDSNPTPTNQGPPCTGSQHEPFCYPPPPPIMNDPTGNGQNGNAPVSLDCVAFANCRGD